MMNSHEVLALAVCVCHGRQHVCKWELLRGYFSLCGILRQCLHLDRWEVCLFYVSRWDETSNSTEITSLATERLNLKVMENHKLLYST